MNAFDMQVPFFSMMPSIYFVFGDLDTSIVKYESLNHFLACRNPARPFIISALSHSWLLIPILLMVKAIHDWKFELQKGIKIYQAWCINVSAIDARGKTGLKFCATREVIESPQKQPLKLLMQIESTL